MTTCEYCPHAHHVGLCLEFLTVRDVTRTIVVGTCQCNGKEPK
jgi:hypothetical protein